MSDGTPTPRHLKRRRRANVTGGRHHEHRVKVTPEEEARLVLLAEEQGVTVARLLVESALSQTGETPTQRRNAITELFALRRLLAQVSNNVNQIAKVANSTGDISNNTTAVLDSTRRTIARIDDTIEGLRKP